MTTARTAAGLTLIAAWALLAAFGTGPALAQAPVPASPSVRNPVMTDNNDVRASKVLGAAVYNDKNEKIGTIDDILMDRQHMVAAAILSVGGFLGLGSKLVQVPYDKLQFGDTRTSNANRVKVPDATKENLQSMPDFHYRR